MEAHEIYYADSPIENLSGIEELNEYFSKEPLQILSDDELAFFGTLTKPF